MMKSQYTKSSFMFSYYYSRPYLKCQQPMKLIKGSSLSYPPVSLEFSTMATHSRTKGCQKRGAATEHTEKKAPRGRSTESAEEKPNAEEKAVEDAKADRADDTIENLLCKLADFSWYCCKTCGVVLQSTKSTNTCALISFTRKLLSGVLESVNSTASRSYCNTRKCGVL